MAATTRTPTRVVIVGAGFAGTLTALHLLHGGRDVDVTLLDASGRFAPGLAYATQVPVHLLNVPVSRMSAFPDRPDDLLEWTRGQGLAASPATFLPRGLYGRYLAQRLEATRGALPAGARLDLRVARAMDVALEGERLAVRLHDGATLAADHVVLAWGNLPPQGPLDAAGGAALPPAAYARDPWTPSALEGLAPDADVLLLGTGLTAVDLLLALRHRGHRGIVHALSRRGLVPQPQDAGSRVYGGGYDPAPVLTAAGDLRRLLRTLRAECRARREVGGDWRDVIAALRPGTPGLWASLGARDRARFLRLLRPFWDTHRHRMAGTVDDAVATLWGTGAFQPRAGRVLSVSATKGHVAVTWRPRGNDAAETLEVARVINATGPSPDLRGSKDPLVQALVRGGLLVPDPLGLGAEVAPDGRVAAPRAPRNTSLWAVGALRMGSLWESTAVPELRVQARDVARAILAAP